MTSANLVLPRPGTVRTGPFWSGHPRVLRADPNGAAVRIEAKGHLATGEITLYYTEWQTAHRIRDEFYISVIDHPLSTPHRWTVRDPVGQGIEPTEKVVEYHVRPEQLRACAEQEVGSADARGGVRVGVRELARLGTASGRSSGSSTARATYRSTT